MMYTGVIEVFAFPGAITAQAVLTVYKYTFHLCAVPILAAELSDERYKYGFSPCELESDTIFYHPAKVWPWTVIDGSEIKLY